MLSEASGSGREFSGLPGGPGVSRIDHTGGRPALLNFAWEENLSNLRLGGGGKEWGLKSMGVKSDFAFRLGVRFGAGEWVRQGQIFKGCEIRLC